MQKKKVHTAILLPLLLLVLAVGDSLYYRNRLYPGVYVHQTPVGGSNVTDLKKILACLEIKLITPGSDPVIFNLQSLGLMPEAESTFATAYQAGRHNRFPLSYPERFRLYKNGLQLPLFQKIEVQELSQLVTALETKLNREPQDAAYQFHSEGSYLTINPETTGFRVNRKKLASVLAALLTNPQRKLVVTVPGTPVAPAVTAEALRKKGIREPIASFTTAFDGYAEDRVHNIRLAVSQLNNLLLAPGETFSLNQVLGDSTPEKGYRKAPIIVGTELVAGYGGGLCQVSTTLYNAALLADLEIVERHHHNMAIPYVPPGRDATISYGSRDLKFRNNTGSYVLIHGAVSANELTFHLIGTPTGKRVVIEPKILKARPFPVKQVQDPDLPAGTEEITDGEPGYLVSVWKTVFRGDELISREQISLDEYRPYPAVIRQGTGPLPEGD